MRCLVWIVVLCFLMGVVIASPPTAPTKPIISPDDCAWTPTAEVCDGIDNDCDGAIDEDDVCGSVVVDDGDEPSSSPSSSPSGGSPSYVTAVSTPGEESEVNTSSGENITNTTNQPLLNDTITPPQENESSANDEPNVGVEPEEEPLFSKEALMYGGGGILLLIGIVVALLIFYDKHRHKQVKAAEKDVLEHHETLKEAGVAGKINYKPDSAEGKAVDYIHRMRSKGFSDKEIHFSLEQSGWHKDHLSSIFSSLSTSSTTGARTTTKSDANSSKEHT